jgi:hypothetical protein
VRCPRGGRYASRPWSRWVADMPALRLVSLRRLRVDGTFWDVGFTPGVNLLVGGQNTSKTTTLRIIDFCFGHPESGRQRFSEAIVSEYQQFELTINVNGEEHVLTRRLHQPGQQGMCDVDGSLMDSREFSEWIAVRLEWGWPPFFVPRGLFSESITHEVPLTFRALYRHIYRRANSWTDWATGEYEYYRRGVLAFFLGIAPELYHGTEVQEAQERLRLVDLRRRQIETREVLNDAVARASEGFRHAGVTTLDTIEQTLDEITDEIGELNKSRDELSRSVRADPHYDAQQDAAVTELHDQLRELGHELFDLRQSVAEQETAASTLRGDVDRISRAREAASSFTSLMVTACPQCHQSVGRNRAEGGQCYVCLQPIREDVRDRRLELEQKVLQAELQELGDAIAHGRERLSLLHARQAYLEQQRAERLARLDSERREMVAPLVREFEAIQHRLGLLDQRHASLSQLVGLRQRVDELERQQVEATRTLEELERATAERQSDQGLVLDRVGELGRHVNEFVGNLPAEGRLGGLVSVHPQTLEFFVGRDTWRNVLGEERKVFLLLAYHYALLRMCADQEMPFPKISIIDNPFQQDVDETSVRVALQKYAALCDEVDDLQVIVATQRHLPEIGGNRIHFDQVFDPESE